MSEHFILHYLPLRIKQLGYSEYHIKHRDFIIEACNTIMIPAYNELLFILGDPSGLIVDSAYGMYDSTSNSTVERVHVHRGEISILNPGAAKRRIQFIQVVIVQ